jgi:hypothetical protein
MPYGHSAEGKTTGDVAEILEEKYHVMTVFFEYRKKQIARDLEKGLAGALESVLMGGPISGSAFGAACSQIEDRFKTDLAGRQFDARGIPGVPTAASGGTSRRQGGINHRLAHPYKNSNPARPSFIDTGLYSASFKVWVD